MSVVFTILCCVSISFAHSGGTDSNGGHYNHSTGEYHYHHGYSAHQHPNGVCPYDFDDRTGQNSGSSAASSTEDRVQVEASVSDNAEVKSEEAENSSSSNVSGMLAVGAAGVVIGILAAPVSASIKKRCGHFPRESEQEGKK